MKLENTNFANYQLVIDDFNIPIGVKIDDRVRYWLYDVVEITADCHGYIGQGISHGGIGTIVRIRRDDTVYFFGVLMNTGEFGYVKSLRIAKVYESQKF